MSTWTAQDRVLLDNMVNDAEARGMWMYCHYQSLWFSPEDLREKHAKGEMLWGVVNWQIRDPQEHLAQLQSEAAGHNSAVKRMEEKLGHG